MDKHAYLIITHGNFKILEKLLTLLDDSRNDIYIHLDKKVLNFDFDYYKKICTCSTVTFTKKRIDVKWGKSSQVKAELILYNLASKKKYNYYHLISGVDLPLKTQDEIHEFFLDKKFEYLYYLSNPTVWDYQRISRYHFPKNWNKYLLMVINKIQDYFKVDRISEYNMSYTRGYNWCSLTDDAVRYLLKNEKFINRICKFSSCADEVYKQYLLINSEFKDRIVCDDLREIDWERRVNDSPHIYTIDDYYQLINSNKFFARKFDEKVDYQIVEQIFNYVKEH